MENADHFLLWQSCQILTERGSVSVFFSATLIPRRCDVGANFVKYLCFLFRRTSRAEYAAIHEKPKYSFKRAIVDIPFQPRGSLSLWVEVTVEQKNPYTNSMYLLLGTNLSEVCYY